ncbi:MAG: hypothetical protein KAS32_29405 [Candidatus Peribacteraceae bacterium]|nr:hypothetical protein [Candidatus Peribacteraceae bacterium]
MDEKEALKGIIENTTETCDECNKPFYKNLKMCSLSDDTIKVLCVYCHPTTKMWLDAFIDNANKIIELMKQECGIPTASTKSVKQISKILGYGG